MKNFAVILRVNTSMSPNADPQEYEDRMNWLNNLEEKGILVNKGGTMPPLPDSACTISAGGELQNGPFMEVSHFITGYLIIKARDIKEAVKINESNPILKSGGTVEIREIYLR